MNHDRSRGYSSSNMNRMYEFSSSSSSHLHHTAPSSSHHYPPPHYSSNHPPSFTSSIKRSHDTFFNNTPTMTMTTNYELLPRRDYSSSNHMYEFSSSYPSNQFPTTSSSGQQYPPPYYSSNHPPSFTSSIKQSHGTFFNNTPTTTNYGLLPRRDYISSNRMHEFASSYPSNQYPTTSSSIYNARDSYFNNTPLPPPTNYQSSRDYNYPLSNRRRTYDFPSSSDHPANSYSCHYPSDVTYSSKICGFDSHLEKTPPVCKKYDLADDYKTARETSILHSVENLNDAYTGMQHFSSCINEAPELEPAPVPFNAFSDELNDIKPNIADIAQNKPLAALPPKRKRPAQESMEALSKPTEPKRMSSIMPLLEQPFYPQTQKLSPRIYPSNSTAVTAPRVMPQLPSASDDIDNTFSPGYDDNMSTKFSPAYDDTGYSEDYESDYERQSNGNLSPVGSVCANEDFQIDLVNDETPFYLQD